MRHLLRCLLPRRGRPRLVLHVGTHKTGTTAIQTTLRDNRAALARAGLCYPDPAREPHPHLPAHNFIYRATLNGAEAMAAERDRIMAEFRASGADHLILSEEGLSLPRDVLQDFFVPWSQDFDFEIVCFLRRQDRYAESLFSQYVRENKPIAHGTIEAFLAAPEIAERLDYDTNLQRWDGFGPVHAVNYDLLKGTELCKPILAAAGTSVRLSPSPQSNVSPPAGVIEVIRHMNRQGLDYALRPLVARLRSDPPEVLQGLFARRSMMGSVLRAEFMSGLAGVNARLADNRGVVFPADMPDEPEGAFHTDLDPDLVAKLAADSRQDAK
ncbi:hypothetical protein [Ponticoccus alexandrii]|uniref:Sulfotransferase family protein n=1 Tax=Ponticoccus alexandrii TaxID=1943633 RepID=A0ABX7FDH1_9RHOB|nr:hypothetical protein [Ponticoccus alexandrii]ETA50657.1 hypothetical protein P279_18415 [Rhodobacteraceae bacterium PD-2]QRF68628.1 hypothetical protein GQA70_19775 [Ponticoccus alexandrii]